MEAPNNYFSDFIVETALLATFGKFKIHMLQIRDNSYESKGVS